MIKLETSAWGEKVERRNPQRKTLKKEHHHKERESLMKNKIDKTLINSLNARVKKEKLIKNIRSRLRIKGILTEKTRTKKGNLQLKIRKGKEDYTFTILKTHKEKIERAEHLQIKRSISIEGINKFRIIICTRFKELDKGIDNSNQTKIDEYTAKSPTK